MKDIIVAAMLWAGCLLALGFLARVMWVIFLLGWNSI